MFVAMARIHVLAVAASPNGSGSTGKALTGVLAGARDEDAEVRLIQLAAESTDSVIAAIEAADAVVFGSPVYRASHTALLADLLEQIGRSFDNEHSTPLNAKAVAIVLTGASHHHFLATEKLRSTLASFFAAQTLSPGLYLTPADFTQDKELNDFARDLARLHGRALVELAAAVRAGDALGMLRPLV